MNNINKDLAKMRDDLHHMELDETDKLFELQDTLESQVFDCSVNIKKLLSSACCLPEALIPPPESKGVRLPKLDVPTFDGNILNWQYSKLAILLGTVLHSVHDHTNLSDSEKLVIYSNPSMVIRLRMQLKVFLDQENTILKP